jgi:hypothetical protein
MRPAPLFSNPGKPWRVEDTFRAQCAGMPIGKYGAVTEYRADWPEIAFHAGFKTWGAHMPCGKCRCSADTMYSGFEDCSMTSLPWDVRGPEDYEVELEAHIHRVTISNEEFGNVQASNQV